MFLVAGVMGLVSAYLASKRGKNPLLWFALGFFFGIFGIFAILFASGPKKAPPPSPREPVLRIDGPVDKLWYYLDPEHKQQGPMSHDALSAAWKTGKVTASTYVWHENMSEWTPLKETLKPESL